MLYEVITQYLAGQRQSLDPVGDSALGIAGMDFDRGVGVALCPGRHRRHVASTVLCPVDPLAAGLAVQGGFS